MKLPEQQCEALRYDLRFCNKLITVPSTFLGLPRSSPPFVEMGMMTSKRIIAAGTILAALLFQLVAARGADDERYEITTRNATYTIPRPKDYEERRCVYRNKEKLFCAPKYSYAFFGLPVRTKNYDLIPLTTHPDGSGSRWWDYSLIVEQGEHGRVKTIVDGCFSDSCEIRATQVNHGADDVRFHVGRSEGSKMTAHFNAGVLSIRKRRISPKEPLNAETCARLFEELNECSELGASNKSDCPSEYSSRSQVTNFFFVGIENDFPGFSREKFDQACRTACITRGVAKRRLCNTSRMTLLSHFPA